MKIYVAGPITKGDQFQNVRRAMNSATALLNLGHSPFVPHLTCMWHMIHPQDYERWLSYDFEWILACDAVLRIDGESLGADREVAFAKEHGLPVYFSIAELNPPSGEGTTTKEKA